ncbi:MAG: Dyp-type peroxidase [Planctomycetes bacterium]|nr:Dyp-type peroxidase [Planctomycetota bacterium]
MTASPQPGILAGLPAHARYLTFLRTADADATSVVRILSEIAVDDSLVVGLGPQLTAAVGAARGAEVPGMRSFPKLQHDANQMPSSAGDLWLWLRADDRGILMHQSRKWIAQLEAAFELTDLTDSFVYGGGLDLTGYEDGTENPVDEHAAKVGIADGTAAPIGSSMVAVQKWLHDFKKFDALSSLQQDHAIGRRRSDNEELNDAPESAHVKRTAQEAFDPEAFVVRRSMPWLDGQQAGLMFVAFGASFDAFEALANNMLGLNDGISDALFQFTTALTGNYYWCPPRLDGHLLIT